MVGLKLLDGERVFEGLDSPVAIRPAAIQTMAIVHVDRTFERNGQVRTSHELTFLCFQFAADYLVKLR